MEETERCLLFNCERRTRPNDSRQDCAHALRDIADIVDGVPLWVFLSREEMNNAKQLKRSARHIEDISQDLRWIADVMDGDQVVSSPNIANKTL